MALDRMQRAYREMLQVYGSLGTSFLYDNPLVANLGLQCLYSSNQSPAERRNK